MTAADKITNWLAQLRASSMASLLSRLVIAIAGTVALVVPTVQSWDQADLVPLLGVPLLLICLVLPDSTAAALFLIVVTAGWLMRAPSELTFSLVVTAIALLAVHLASAFAAQIPSYGKVSRRALRRWLLPAMIAGLLGPVVAVAAAVVRGADVPGSLVVTVAALAAATAAVWFAAGQSASGNG
ncbi:hypothetical protein F1D05_27075 [Kribbella qitaiheensis]|uniref:Uncharacterized protein n=1 Tax=Kribbella qitaiheensis TaxID=1544730 RepID=A0A7G6X3U1_9ACTN|nr:hypothetical protein [Kribbella qitaiheensis]QNE20906.1 hypothetical protein F1D05_27075 [Kribbella qitaiheensis]